MIDMSSGGVCLCVHPQCVRKVFWGNWGMSDGNDLTKIRKIEETYEKSINEETIERTVESDK